MSSKPGLINSYITIARITAVAGFISGLFAVVEGIGLTSITRISSGIMPGGNALILSLLGISLYLLSRQTSSRHRVGDMAAYGCAMTAITISLLGLNRPIKTHLTRSPSDGSASRYSSHR